MLDLSRFLFAAASILIGLGLLASVASLVTLHARARVPVGAGGPAVDDEPARAVSPVRGLGWFGSRLVELALVALTIGLVLRTIATGHAPFANQYEFAVSFAWGVVAAYVWFDWRYRLRVLAPAVLPIALAMLLYASTVSSEANALMPALQNHFLLTLHVITAVIAYGAAGVAFGAAGLYLLRDRLPVRGLPSAEVLDEVGYRAVVVAFPFMTIMIILGAIWADIAWGRYWSWDPKETSALVTWLIYGAYLHARVVRDWRGSRAAWLLILGFTAILFTYFGNLFFGGLHSYA